MNIRNCQVVTVLVNSAKCEKIVLLQSIIIKLEYDLSVIRDITSISTVFWDIFTQQILWEMKSYIKSVEQTKNCSIRPTWSFNDFAIHLFIIALVLILNATFIWQRTIASHSFSMFFHTPRKTTNFLVTTKHEHKQRAQNHDYCNYSWYSFCFFWRRSISNVFAVKE